MKTQIWIAVSVYVLVAIIRKRLGDSLYEILQIPSLTMFERMPMDSPLSQRPPPDIGDIRGNQLKLFD